MAARNATKATKATTQENAEKAQAKPAVDQQAPATPPTTPPADQSSDSLPPSQDDAPSADMVADYVFAEGFTLTPDGDVVDAAGLTLPPVCEGEGGAAMVLLSLAKACMPAIEPPSIILGTVAEQFDQQIAADKAAARPPVALPENFGELSRAALDVLFERERQVIDKGYTGERDDAYTSYELPRAAGCYAMNAGGIPRHRSIMYWPFEPAAFKPKGYRADLIKAAALLLAEIERIDRAGAPA